MKIAAFCLCLLAASCTAFKVAEQAEAVQQKKESISIQSRMSQMNTRIMMLEATVKAQGLVMGVQRSRAMGKQVSDSVFIESARAYGLPPGFECANTCLDVDINPDCNDIPGSVPPAVTALMSSNCASTCASPGGTVAGIAAQVIAGHCNAGSTSSASATASASALLLALPAALAAVQH